MQNLSPSRETDEIDVEKYLDYMRSTFDQILGSLGYDFDEILGATKLEDFSWSAAKVREGSELKIIITASLLTLNWAIVFTAPANIHSSAT